MNSLGTDLELAEANAATYVTMLRRHAHMRGGHPALRSAGGTVSYGELDRAVDMAAAALSGVGVGAGDRVALFMNNRVEFVTVLAGCNRLGAIGVPINHRLSGSEVAFILTDSGSTAVVTDAARSSVLSQALACLDTAVATFVAGEEPAVPMPAKWISWSDALASATQPQPLSPAAVTAWMPTSPALIMYTSGTTGRPKGAVLTHLNLLMQTLTRVRNTRQGMGNETVLVATPLFHIAGLATLIPSLLLGHTVVLAPDAAFDPAALLDLIESEQVTSMFLVPTQWQALCDQPDLPERRLSLRYLSWGASPASHATLAKMAQAFPGAAIVATFGQTEMSPITCALDGPDAVRKIGSVGKPIATIDTRIVDDDMRDVPPGEVGEILYRGPSMMAGYWNNPAATDEAMRGGWLHSGDLVKTDDEGFIYVVDRKKDMIISGGENIYSAELEGVISAHPKVREVAVIGVPHPKWVESPAAVIVPNDLEDPPSESEIVGWTRERLASYKKPTVVSIVASLPRNASGKVLKRVLRDQLRSTGAERPNPAEPCGITDQGIQPAAGGANEHS
jgi:fatty-acyl-CoA synthase